MDPLCCGQLSGSSTGGGSGCRPLTFPSRAVRQRFEVQDLAGRGAFGDVWACRDRETGELCACKVLDRAHQALTEDLEGEISALGRLGDAGGHRGVVALYGVYRHRSKVHIIMQMCPGGDLFSLIKRRGKMPEAVAKALFRQLASALAFCHSQGILHRDIKPENILFDSHPDTVYFSSSGLDVNVQAMVADFGLAIPLEEGATIRGYWGTSFYAAPEVVRWQPYDMAADVWSLGVVLFVMLSGRLPMIGPHGEDVEGDWGRGLRNCAQTLKDARCDDGTCHLACSLLEKMLHQDPGKRPSLEQVLNDEWIVQSDGSEQHICPKQSSWLRGTSLPGSGSSRGNSDGSPGMKRVSSSVISEATTSTLSDSTVASMSSPCIPPPLMTSSILLGAE